MRTLIISWKKYASSCYLSWERFLFAKKRINSKTRSQNSTKSQSKANKI